MAWAGLGGVVDLLEDAALELAVEALQVKHLGGVHEAGDHPDDEADGAEVGAHEGLDVRALHLDRHRLAGRGEHGPVHLAQGGRGGGLPLEGGEQLPQRATELTLHGGHHVGVGRRGHLVLQRGQHLQRPLR